MHRSRSSKINTLHSMKFGEFCEIRCIVCKVCLFFFSFGDVSVFFDLRVQFGYSLFVQINHSFIHVDVVHPGTQPCNKPRPGCIAQGHPKSIRCILWNLVNFVRFGALSLVDPGFSGGGYNVLQIWSPSKSQPPRVVRFGAIGWDSVRWWDWVRLVKVWDKVRKGAYV